MRKNLKTSGIYAIINICNGRTYIGSAINIQRRWEIHKDELKRNIHGNIYLQDAFNKHGINILVFSLIEFVKDKSKLLEREQLYMERFNSIVPNGYNICKIAGSRLGTKHSEKTKTKLSIARQKRIIKDETRIKISKAHTNRIMTSDHKERLSKAAKGVPKSEAHKQALKVASRKRWDKFLENTTVIGYEPN